MTIMLITLSGPDLTVSPSRISSLSIFTYTHLNKFSNPLELYFDNSYLFNGPVTFVLFSKLVKQMKLYLTN